MNIAIGLHNEVKLVNQVEITQLSMYSFKSDAIWGNLLVSV